MSSLQTIASTDTLNPTSLGKINDNFSTLNTDKAEKSGWTFTGDIVVPDEAYWAWWDGSLEVPTKNAVYDKIQAMPALSDWDKGDIVVSGSGATWTVDSWVITNAKLANVASSTFKGRTTVGTGSPEDMTATQATALLNTATTSLKGLLPASGWGTTNFLRADLTWTNPNEWTLLTSSSYTAWGTYDSWTLTTYDLYKIVISGTSSWSNTFLWLRLNNDASPSTYVTYSYNAGSTSLSSSSDWYYQILSHNTGSWWPFYWEYVMTGRDTALIWSSFAPISVGQTLAWGYKPIVVTSIQLSTIITISGNIKIYGKNY